MAEFTPTLIEYGVLGFLCCYLVLKGVPAMQALSASIKALSDVILKLQAQLELNTQHIKIIDHRLDKIESSLNRQQQDYFVSKP